MDQFDRKILAIVQQDCTRKAEAIAEEVGLSASAVQRRLRVLRAAGVIRAEVALVDPQSLGPGMSFIAGMEIERDNYAALQKLQAWAGASPHVQQLYYVTGAMDLIAIILARDVGEYDAITARLMQENPLIRRITTNVVLQPVKTGLAVPISDA